MIDASCAISGRGHACSAARAGSYAYVHNQVVDELAKSETVSAVLRAKPDIADQRTETGAIARGMTLLFKIIFILHPVGCGTVMI